MYGGLTQKGAVYRGYQPGWWVSLSSRVSLSPYYVLDAAG